jgi:3-phenylpropionate/trans-cinnamate dioxygenase ferredoxin subunit
LIFDRIRHDVERLHELRCSVDGTPWFRRNRSLNHIAIRRQLNKMALHRVCRISDLNPGEVRRIDDPPVAVFNVNGAFFAISDVCTHAEASLSEGQVDGETVECPLHGACFDLRTGEALTPPAIEPVPTFAVVLQDDEVYVEVGGSG